MIASINLEIPLVQGHEVVEVPSFEKLSHQYAVEASDGSYQVRYKVKPLEGDLNYYKKQSKGQRKYMKHPNENCKSAMKRSVILISDYKRKDFIETTFKKPKDSQYGVHWKAITTLDIQWPELEYKMCSIICLHRDDVADVFIYILANDLDDISEGSKMIYNSVQFK